jgi:hypothetical protein
MRLCKGMRSWWSCRCGDTNILLHPLCLPGRIFNGSGKPIDKGPAVMAEEFLDINGKRAEAAHGLEDTAPATV